MSVHNFNCKNRLKWSFFLVKFVWFSQDFQSLSFLQEKLRFLSFSKKLRIIYVDDINAYDRNSFKVFLLVTSFQRATFDDMRNWKK